MGFYDGLEKVIVRLKRTRDKRLPWKYPGESYFQRWLKMPKDQGTMIVHPETGDYIRPAQVGQLDAFWSLKALHEWRDRADEDTAKILSGEIDLSDRPDLMDLFFG
jgi:hypothetical protein